MKDPFVKQDHTTAIVLGATGVAAAAAIAAYLYLTESGSGVRDKISASVNKSIDSISELIKENFKDAAATVVSQKTPLSKKAAKVVADHVVK